MLLYQPIGPDTLKHVETAHTIMPYKVNGGWKHGPTIVCDSDDNLFNVNPYNPAFRSLGIRDQNGQEIPNGSVIGDQQGGKKRILWHDGECRPEWGCTPECKRKISLQNNKQGIESYRQILTETDGFTCTTKEVLSCVQREVQLSHYAVFPNCVRFDHYPQLEMRQDESQVRILWQGGGAHFEDWYPLREALGDITRKYPQIHWVIWGAMYHWVMDQIPPDRYTYTPWCPYPEYKLRRVMQNDDISLAPLEDNRFNRCRSAIKFYEASVSRKPAATLAQDTAAYKEEILDGQTGLLWNTPSQFVDKLSLLIEDVTLRRTLASNAKDWVNENRNAFREVPKQIAWLEQLREISKRERPHMADSAWTAFEESIRKAQEGESEAKDGPVQPVLQGS